LNHWDIFSHDLKGLLETVVSPPVIGIGHSLGAVVTYMAASSYPHLFSSIILIDPPIMPKSLLWLVRFLRLFGLHRLIPQARRTRRRRPAFNNKSEALNRFLSGNGIFKTWRKEFVCAYLDWAFAETDDGRIVLKCDPEIEAGIFEKVPVDTWRYAERITCPVLLVRGQYSDTFYPSVALGLKKKIRDFTFLTVEGAGHFIPMEKPETCVEAINDFIGNRS
jgi:pimeloyl-ACP methyl ester carboxylesterase